MDGAGLGRHVLTPPPSVRPTHTRPPSPDYIGLTTDPAIKFPFYLDTYLNIVNGSCHEMKTDMKLIKTILLYFGTKDTGVHLGEGSMTL